MDAYLTLGMEFSGYYTQLENSIKTMKESLAHLSELALGGTAVEQMWHTQRIPRMVEKFLIQDINLNLQK